MTKKKNVNIFDLGENELKNVSKKIIQETTERTVPAQKLKKEKEALKVLRVRLNFHKKAKRMAFDRDIMIQELIEELIQKEWEQVGNQ